jgi:uncharacterized protein YceH (UPF0502 family)
MSAPLTPVEVRLLGCLIEKRLSTPEYYPLTANSLLAACNQKSNRDPVLELDPARVEQGLTALRARQLVTAQTGSGQRTEKYLERFCERSGLLPREQALLAELLLRGPQTPGELRTRCTRMVEPGSLEDVQEVLEALLALEPPLVHQLERQPGKGRAPLVPPAGGCPGRASWRGPARRRGGNGSVYGPLAGGASGPA